MAGYYIRFIVRWSEFCGTSELIPSMISTEHILFVGFVLSTRTLRTDTVLRCMISKRPEIPLIRNFINSLLTTSQKWNLLGCVFGLRNRIYENKIRNHSKYSARNVQREHTPKMRRWAEKYSIYFASKKNQQRMKIGYMKSINYLWR